MKNAPKFVETMVSNLAIKSTQSITGKVKYLKDAVMVGETLIPMTAILVVANNTVFYTKFSNVGKIVHVEQKNGMVAYVLESGAVVTVVDPSAVQVMVQAVKVPCEEEEPEEEAEEEEDSEEEEEEDSDDEEEESEEEEDSDEEEDEEESEEEEEDSEEEDSDDEEEEEESEEEEDDSDDEDSEEEEEEEESEEDEEDEEDSDEEDDEEDDDDDFNI